MAVKKYKKGNLFSIDRSSELGNHVNHYIVKCVNAEMRIRDFLGTLHSKYRFPVVVTKDTPYILQSNCAAGGLLAIVCDKDNFLDAIRIDAHAAVMWDFMQCPDNPEKLYVFPRIEAKRSEPVTPSSRIAKKFPILGGYPMPSVRYVLNNDTLPDCVSKTMASTNSKYYSDAVELYTRWMSLPIVSSFELPRLLKLSVPDKSSPHKDLSLCYCEWKVDKENNRILVFTGLESSSPDMIRIDDKSVYEKYFLNNTK